MSLLCTAQTETLETLTNTVSQCFVRGSPPSGKVVSHEPPPLPLGISNDLPWGVGGYGYFLEPHNTTYFSVYTQVCYRHVLSLERSIKTILKHYFQRS